MFFERKGGVGNKPNLASVSWTVLIVTQFCVSSHPEVILGSLRGHQNPRTNTPLLLSKEHKQY